MEQEKKLTLIFALIIFGLIGAVVWGSMKNKGIGNNPNTAFILYYGNTCTHCKELEEWIKVNDVRNKVKIVDKEVFDNPGNSSELSIRAKKCGLDPSKVGVPFMYAEGKCYMGKPDVQEFLSLKVGIEKSEASGSANLEASESGN